MELDTGVAVSLMLENTLKHLWPEGRLSLTRYKLCSYLKEPIPGLRSFNVEIVYKNQLATLPLTVKGDGATLLGKNWLNQIILCLIGKQFT